MRIKLKKAIQLIAIIIIGIFMVATVVGFAHKSADMALANGPIPPPEGYPKLSLSSKVVSPTLANTEGAVLEYSLEILNTGAYSASDVTLVDAIPNNTLYNDDVWSSAPPSPVFNDGVITWEHGKVGFDDSVVITFSVTVTPGYEGIVSNTAVINDPMIAEPVSITAETRVTDHPMFEISKSATPDLPGKNKPLTYELVVTNQGQAAENVPITVTDFIPENTASPIVGPGGSVGPGGDVVTFTRSVNMGFGETTSFTFSVVVADVPSGTVLNNDVYLVASPDDIKFGEPYTTTVIDPIFILSKSIDPDPPGANREMTYTLTVFNLGSEATELVITDTVPAEVTYVRGGNYNSGTGIVTWEIPRLDTRESAQVTFTVYIGDIADIIVLNGNYGVCSAEGVCAPGIPVPSYIVGPTFEVTASVDPIAHKPGGGSDPKEKVTPSFTIHNLGPGNAIDASALLTLGNISVSNADVFTVLPPGNGTVVTGPECTIWAKCWHYTWTGDMNVGDIITITTIEPQSTIGGAEWTPYTATVVVTDALGTYVTEPITATAVGHVTHMSNLIPIKSAPPEIGPGQTMTYTIMVVDSGLSTEATPYLTETVPTSVTLIEDSISDGGTWDIVNNRTVISWTLPAMGPGDYLFRSFAVTADPALVSGTLIVNDEYQTSVYESWINGIKTIVGEPVTTTVHEVGLIDSYKTVTPTWALPGTGTVLTWTVHVVNSGPSNLVGVQVSDVFPWEHSTYQRDAIASASAGSLISDIVSLDWTGDVAPYSEELITFTTLVDDFFEGVLTNTATISHTSLKAPVDVTAVAYITDKPVLRITKVATPDPVLVNTSLLYQIWVTNLGQQATLLVVTDTVPANTSYIFGSASSGGQLQSAVVEWTLPVLDPGETLKITFQVKVLGGNKIINDSYAVRCAEGVSDYGDPVVTRVRYLIRRVLLPIVAKE
jgi:uncharacterized repeat protein (TIGR01451 family)